MKKRAPAPKSVTAERETRRITFPPVKGKEEGITMAQTVFSEELRRFKGSFIALRLWGEE